MHFDLIQNFNVLMTETDRNDQEWAQEHWMIKFQMSHIWFEYFFLIYYLTKVKYFEIKRANKNISFVLLILKLNVIDANIGNKIIQKIFTDITRNPSSL
jgi:hypothetical protein